MKKIIVNDVDQVYNYLNDDDYYIRFCDTEVPIERQISGHMCPMCSREDCESGNCDEYCYSHQNDLVKCEYVPWMNQSLVHVDGYVCAYGYDEDGVTDEDNLEPGAYYFFIFTGVEGARSTLDIYDGVYVKPTRTVAKGTHLPNGNWKVTIF